MTGWECIKLSVLGVLAGFIFVQVLNVLSGNGTILGGDQASVEPANQGVSVYGGKTGSSGNPFDSGANEPPTPFPTIPPTEPMIPNCVRGRKYVVPAWAEGTRATIEKAASFFILSNGASLNSSIVSSCFFDILNIPSNKSSGKIDVNTVLKYTLVEDRNNFNFAMTDIALMDAFKRHPSRVETIEEADFVLIDFLPYVSFEILATEETNAKCPQLAGALESHEERVLTAVDALNENEFWGDEKSRSKFMLIHSRPIGQRGAKDVLTARFFEQMTKAGAHVLTVSKQFLSEAAKKMLPKKAFSKTNGAQMLIEHAIPVPLLPNPFIADYAFVKNREVPIDFFLKEVYLNSKKTVRAIKAFNFQFVLSRPKIGAVSRAVGLVDRRKDLAIGFLSSKMCLVMPFDFDEPYVAGLQGVFDSIASGCIPVLMFDQDPLPFSNQIDWLSVSHITAGVHCFANYPEEVQILERDATKEENVKQHQESLAKVRNMFEFPSCILDPRVQPRKEHTQAFGVVDALLKELNLLPSSNF